MSSASKAHQHEQQQDASGVTLPCRLELSLDPNDGSLVTAPLSTVLLSATDGLYTDLYQMAHGELDDVVNEGAPSREKMSNLSFAQRRHELAWRLAQHAKGLSHVAALTAASCSSQDFTNATKVSTKALQHARTAWVQADEAQDALYFFHAQLFPARASPHDVYGALDMMKSGEWRDMSTDVMLQVDKYDLSRESQWTKREVAEQWHMAVLDKLIQGEVGWMKQNSIPSLWKIFLEKSIVKLTYGTPKVLDGGSTITTKFPLEAQLTVFSTAKHAEWTLLSINVDALPKTGESNHQLDLTNRQRFDLHKLCVMAMQREEAALPSKNDSSQQQPPITRPLQAMFEVAFAFHLSWQLEILNAQAQAMKKQGVWGAGQNATLQVTPVTFHDNEPTLGEMKIFFWSVDDRYGPPRVCDLSSTDLQEENAVVMNGDMKEEDTTKRVTNMLTLFIRAVANVGMRISLSGGNVIEKASKTDPRVKETVQKLLEAASDPFALSASNALLAATTLCGECKCHAIVHALTSQKVLPKWTDLTVERTSIAVAAQVEFDSHQEGPSPFVVLFRLECDARSGTFCPTFPRSTTLLRLLACNHISASETMALALSKAAQHRRKGIAAAATGRFVKDAFDGLVRSMNLLGQRTGVGGEWMDVDERSASLRERAIQLACADVKVSLATCCGVAAVYGLSALSLGVATGVTAVADMSGGPLSESVNVKGLLAAPPVGVVLDQRMVEKVSPTNDGDKKRESSLERDVFAVSCTVTDDAVTLYGFDITVQSDSPVSLPHRIQAISLQLKTLATPESDERPTKRSRAQINGGAEKVTIDLTDEVATLAAVFSNTLDL